MPRRPSSALATSNSTRLGQACLSASMHTLQYMRMQRHTTNTPVSFFLHMAHRGFFLCLWSPGLGGEGIQEKKTGGVANS